MMLIMGKEGCISHRSFLMSESCVQRAGLLDMNYGDILQGLNTLYNKK